MSNVQPHLPPTTNSGMSDARRQHRAALAGRLVPLEGFGRMADAGKGLRTELERAKKGNGCFQKGNCHLFGVLLVVVGEDGANEVHWPNCPLVRSCTIGNANNLRWVGELKCHRWRLAAAR